jgi:hypothetical protein
MTIIMRILTVILIFTPLYASAANCPYPKKPINWIARYCAMVVETDDETIIQDSPCFKASAQDMQAANTCQINEKYKTKICQEFMMESKKYASLQHCMNDPDISPYVSG